MRKATLHISNNQASVSITMPSTPPHKANRRKDSADQQAGQAIGANLPTVSNTLTKNLHLTEQKSLTSPRSPSPLYDTNNELLNTSNTTSVRYPSQSLVMTQAALSSTLSTTMSNAHFQQQQQQQHQQQQQQQQQSGQSAQLKTQQDLEEQYFATIESGALAFQSQNQRQKSSRGKPKLLRQAHAELMELPRVTRDRLPSATPSSFSNYSGTCPFTTNYSAGLTPSFTPNQGGYFDMANASSSFGEKERTSTSNYYSYFEDANSFVAQKAISTAAAQAATQSSNNPNLRNLSFISTSQSSQPHPQSPNPQTATDFRTFSRIRDQQQNSMNVGRLATESNPNELDSSFEYLSRSNLRCRSVPLLAIHIKNEPDTPEHEELNIVERQEIGTHSAEKELITFIDFLNEESTSTGKIDQIKEQPSTSAALPAVDPSKQLDEQDDVRLDYDEDGYADVESISEIMNFSDRQQTVIKRDRGEKPVDWMKDEQDGSAKVDKNDKNDFLIDSHHHPFDKFEEKENRSPISDDDGALELEEEDELEDDGEHIQLLPSTPSTYSLFQKLMNKHGSKEGGHSNQNTLRKQSSDVESQNRSNSLVAYNTSGGGAASYRKHRHRRKKDDDSLVVLDVLDDQSNRQADELHSSEPRTSPTSKSHKKPSDGNEKRTRQSKKAKDKQTTNHPKSKHRSEDAWLDMPNAELNQLNQPTPQQRQPQHIELIKNEQHIQTSSSLPSSRSMQLCQANSYDQGNDPNALITADQPYSGQSKMRSDSKESIKSPKFEKKKRKFSKKKAFHLLKVNHFRKSKSEETGKELESLALGSKTLAAVCKARSYNYNLIKNMTEYSVSQQSSVFNSANNSYEENYHIINTGNGSGAYIEQQQQQSMPSHFNPQQSHLNQQYHSNQLLQQQYNKATVGHLQSNLHHSTQYNQATNFVDNAQTNQPLMSNDPMLNDDSRLFAVHVHNTDRKLKSSKGIVNPLVKVHVVNVHTGEYLQTSEFQSQIGQNAGLYLGSMQDKLYVHPITTQPCDLLFKFRYPKNPNWEELLIFNESYSFLKQNDVILFFEILDYVRLEHSDLLSSFQLNHWCYRVCWGYFLLNNLQNQLGNQPGQMIKLQLYKPYMHTVEKTFDPYCQVYNWWKNYKTYKRVQYPASLFLTLTTVSIRELSNPKHPIHLRILNKSLCQQYLNQRRLPDWTDSNEISQALNLQPQPIDQTFSYSNRALKQVQQLQTNNSSLEDTEQVHTTSHSQAMASGHLHTAQSSSFHQNHQSSLPSTQQPPSQKSTQLSNWNKSSAGSTNSQQHCKLPSATWHQLSAGNNKCCYNVAFSNDGTKIACCASVFSAYLTNEKRSSIFIYDIPGGNFLQRVNGFHSAPIYYLDWSKGDKLLASASADCTCLVWQMRRAHCAPLILNHPCFVYSVKFHPTNHYLLATGAFDGAVRLWSIHESLKSTIKEPILLQCVVASGSVAAATFHGQVLALCWMNYLVDYMGPNGPEQKNELLLFSGCSRGNLMALKQDDLSLSWLPHKKMKIKEIMNIAINEIQCCPNDRLILFCRDGVQRMVDIVSESITMRYIGSLNFNHLIRGCISTDGKFLFAGSEDAIVHVWNIDTGERIYTYNNLPFRGSIASIHYHPFEDIIAISGLNARTISVCLYKHPSRELPSNQVTKPKLSSDPNYLQSSSTTSQITPKASMVTSSGGHTTVSFAGGEYKEEDYMLTNKSAGSLGSACTERTRLTKNKPELKKSHTIDHSSNTSSSMPSKANQKVQKAMKKLELALRLSFNEKS